jgi:hypothetical protein
MTDNERLYHCTYAGKRHTKPVIYVDLQAYHIVWTGDGETTVAHQGQGLVALSGSEIFINHDVELGSWYSVTRECYRTYP